jgi:hypothetical protein
MDEQGLPIFITLIISAVIIGVFVFVAGIINAILQL